MAITQEELNHFQHFAAEKLAAGEGAESLQELLDLWQYENPDPSRLRDDVRAVQSALRDLENGDRGVPHDDHLRELKALEQHHSLSGFTSLILSLGALVSHTTADVVAQALKTVHTKQVWTWCRTVLGPSVQSLRKLAYHSNLIPETKPG